MGRRSREDAKRDRNGSIEPLKYERKERRDQMETAIRSDIIVVDGERLDEALAKRKYDRRSASRYVGRSASWLDGVVKRSRGLTRPNAKLLESMLGIKPEEYEYVRRRLPVDRVRLENELAVRNLTLATASKMLDHAKDYLSVQFTQNEGRIFNDEIQKIEKAFGISYDNIRPTTGSVSAISLLEPLAKEEKSEQKKSDPKEGKTLAEMTKNDLFRIVYMAVKSAILACNGMEHEPETCEKRDAEAEA